MKLILVCWIANIFCAAACVFSMIRRMRDKKK